MGASSSGPEDFPALPQQQIVNVSDGQALGSASAVPVRVGTTKQAVAVRSPLTLHSAGLALRAGVVEVEVSAETDSFVDVLAPGVEQPPMGSQWPTVLRQPGTPVRRRTVPAGSARLVLRFDQPGELVDWPPETPQGHNPEELRRWPIVVVLRPGAPPAHEQASQDPPDGTLIACCSVNGDRMRVHKHVVAWGGQGYPMQNLYGIQEAHQGLPEAPAGTPAAAELAAQLDGQRNCVVCLTSPKDTALLPCGHFSVCYDCGAALRLAPARNRCPLCRQEVQDIVKIDVATRTAAAAKEAAGGQLVQQGAAEPRGGADEGAASTASLTGPDAPAADPAAPATEAAASKALTPEELRAVRLRALERAGASAAVPAPEPTPAAAAPPAGPAVPAATASAAPPVPGGEEGLPPRCLQRLTRELRLIEEERTRRLAEHGVDIKLADPSGNDLRVWSLRILASGIDAQSELGKELRRHGIEVIELEAWVPNAFPVEPPLVRVLRPYFPPGSFYVFQNGALCLEVLTKEGWTPAISLPQLGVEVKTMMSQGRGSIGGPGSCGEAGPSARERARAVAQRLEDTHTDWQRFPVA